MITRSVAFNPPVRADAMMSARRHNNNNKTSDWESLQNLKMDSAITTTDNSAMYGTVDRSAHDWTNEQVPAPSRFVRGRGKQPCVKAFSGAHTTFRRADVSQDKPATCLIGDDLWAFEGNTLPTTTHSMIYAAHREHVALELSMSNAGYDEGHDYEDWDHLLSGLSLGI